MCVPDVAGYLAALLTGRSSAIANYAAGEMPNHQLLLKYHIYRYCVSQLAICACKPKKHWLRRFAT